MSSTVMYLNPISARSPTNEKEIINEKKGERTWCQLKKDANSERIE